MRSALLASAAVFAFLVCACARVDGTGRRQLLLTSPAQENQMGAQAYTDAKGKEKPCNDAATIAFVQRIGQRLAQVAKSKDSKFDWEFTVFESDTVNAWCLPGGKVAVYTGILPFCENEAGLAAVMGHEIGHAIARHGGERMSQGAVVGVAGETMGAVLQSQGIDPNVTNISMAAFGGLSQVGVILPFSRKQESEADYLGLKYMSEAGYDPHEAVKFWGRFAKLGSGGTPAFLSTHPQSADRARDLEAKMGEAEKLYQAAPEKHGAGEPVPPRYREMKTGGAP
ncbi:MAG: M48 family metallopeptidase [Planctomycetes bacterium]|nr:M48 family metallopeptidase [Planctomycetota bacterium]